MLGRGEQGKRIESVRLRFVYVQLRRIEAQSYLCPVRNFYHLS